MSWAIWHYSCSPSIEMQSAGCNVYLQCGWSTQTLLRRKRQLVCQCWSVLLNLCFCLVSIPTCAAAPLTPFSLRKDNWVLQTPVSHSTWVGAPLLQTAPRNQGFLVQQLFFKILMKILLLLSRACVCKVVTVAEGLGPSGWRSLAGIHVSQKQGRTPAARESLNWVRSSKRRRRMKPEAT